LETDYLLGALLVSPKATKSKYKQQKATKSEENVLPISKLKVFRASRLTWMLEHAVDGKSAL
jgi:hypothetical protein